MTSGSNRLQLSVTNSSIAVAGEIDAESAPQLEAAIDQFGASDKVRLDVAGVTFIDSSALRVLVAQHHRLDGAGGRLEIVNPSKSVVRLFEITSARSDVPRHQRMRRDVSRDVASTERAV